MSSEYLNGIPFELKELSDTGDFVGFASIYGNVDKGGDVVERGAFDDSIAQYGNKVRLMSAHKVPIGVAVVESTPVGLKATGKINTKKQSGAEAVSDLQFYRDNGHPMGMSIGYHATKVVPSHLSKDGARHLEQIRLYEVTLTEFPMNERANVVSVKSMHDLIASVKTQQASGNADLNSALERIQVMASRYHIAGAMQLALDDAIAGPAENNVDPITESRKCIDAFRDEYMDMLPGFLDLKAATGMDWIHRPELFEVKAGRVLSQANRDQIANCIAALQALLQMADTKKETESEKSDSPTGDAAKSEPDDHHSADEILTGLQSIRSLIPA